MGSVHCAVKTSIDVTVFRDFAGFIQRCKLCWNADLALFGGVADRAISTVL